MLHAAARLFCLQQLQLQPSSSLKQPCMQAGKLMQPCMQAGKLTPHGRISKGSVCKVQRLSSYFWSLVHTSMSNCKRHHAEPMDRSALTDNGIFIIFWHRIWKGKISNSYSDRREVLAHRDACSLAYLLSPPEHELCSRAGSSRLLYKTLRRISFLLWEVYCAAGSVQKV